MSDFKTALKFVLSAEGGFDSDPDDHGGDTNFGIIQSEYDQYRKAKDLSRQSVRFISEEEVEEIYFKEYWQRAQCEVFPWPLSLVHFDGCVNTGIKQAVKFLQRSVGTISDGVIGPMTIRATLEQCRVRGAGNVASAVMDQRRPFYQGLADKEASQGKFLKGWLNRLTNLEQFIEDHDSTPI